MEGWMAKKNKKNIVQPYMMKACKPRRTTAPRPPSASGTSLHTIPKYPKTQTQTLSFG